MTWLVRFWIQLARPCARGGSATGSALVDHDAATNEVVDVDAGLLAVVLLLGVGERRAHELGERRARSACVERSRIAERVLDALAADLVRDEPRLAGADPVAA